MTRTLFLLTCLAAMVMAMTAVLIRIELAEPGVSALFSGLDGAPDSAKFDRAVTAHTLFAYLAATLLGTTLCAAARKHGAPLAFLPMWLGVILSATLFIVITAAHIPASLMAPEAAPSVAAGADAGTGTGTGWVLYPPLSTAPASLLDLGLTALDVEPLMITMLVHYLLLPAGAMLLLGLYAMTATLHGYRGMMAFGLFATLCVTAVILATPDFGTGQLPMASFNIAALPLLAVLSIHLIDQPTPWVMLMALGLLATLAGQIAIISLNAPFSFQNSMAQIVPLYIFPLGIGWFALPAVILYDRRSRLPDWAAPAVALALTSTLLLWLSPLMFLGRRGQPARYPDYPEAFAASNFGASLAVGLFILTYLGVVILARRAPRSA